MLGFHPDVNTPYGFESSRNAYQKARGVKGVEPITWSQVGARRAALLRLQEVLRKATAGQFMAALFFAISLEQVCNALLKRSFSFRVSVRVSQRVSERSWACIDVLHELVLLWKRFSPPGAYRRTVQRTKFA